MKKLLTSMLLAVIAVAPAAAQTARQDFPTRPIRIVVPFAPGGSTDILVRPIADRMSAILKVPVIIDNRGGAGGNIGADIVAKAQPDGYTLMVTTSGVLVANRSLYAQLSYDPERDFTPVSVLASLPNVLVVHPSSPYKTVADLVAAGKQKPSPLTYASGGIGTSNHLAGELMKFNAGVDAQHVPFRGGGPAVLAVVSGQVSALFATMPTAIGQIKGGKLRPLAVTSKTRSAALPDVPTMAEAGVNDSDIAIWIGAAAPAGTPAPIVERLNKAFVEALDTPSVQERLKAEGYDKVASSPAEMAQVVRTESAMWARVIKAANIRAE